MHGARHIGHVITPPCRNHVAMHAPWNVWPHFFRDLHDFFDAMLARHIQHVSRLVTTAGGGGGGTFLGLCTPHTRRPSSSSYFARYVHGTPHFFRAEHASSMNCPPFFFLSAEHYDTMISPKLQLPLASALVFVILASPTTFKFMNDTVGVPLLKTKFIESGVTTNAGLIVHGVVFFLIAYAFLQMK
jgi:hypothetical protein